MSNKSPYLFLPIASKTYYQNFSNCGKIKYSDTRKSLFDATDVNSNPRSSAYVRTLLSCKKILIIIVMQWLGIFAFTIELDAKIRNGYEHELKLVAQSIQNTIFLINQENNQGLKLSKLKKQLVILLNRERVIKKYYYKTELVLESLKKIDPHLYSEIDTIRDRQNNFTDVYVKVTAKSSKTIVLGSTNLKSIDGDHDVYSSKYGPYTVSVNVVDGPGIGIQRSNPLCLLVHEFGHVKYQVPNLASYSQYFHQKYSPEKLTEEPRGHEPGDPSGIFAKTALAEFYKNFRAYKNGKPKNQIAITKLK